MPDENKELKDHSWPKGKDEHVWTPWRQNGRTSLYHRCVHPNCHAFEVVDAPKG